MSSGPQIASNRPVAHRSRALVVVVAVLLALPTVTLSPAYAAEDGLLSVRLVEAPEGSRDEPRARIYVVDHLAPGSSITRHLEVSNGTNEAQTVDLYPGPTEIVDGLWSPKVAGATSELTAWTHLDLDRVRLPPGSAVTVPFTIDVPTDASAGERLGVVWASVGSDGAGEVRMISRVGIRVYLSIGPGGAPATDFTVEKLVSVRLPSGRFQVRADVANSGGRAVDLEGALRLKAGPGGVTAGPFPALVGTSLAPGDHGQVVVDLPAGLPQGSWHATLRLSSGLTQRSVGADLVLGEAVPGARPQPARQRTGIPARTWAGTGALLAALLALGWVLARSGGAHGGRRARRS